MMRTKSLIDDYNRVIDSDLVKHVKILKIGEDNFIGMKLGIRKGDDARLDRRIVKKRAVGKDELPIGSDCIAIRGSLATILFFSFTFTVPSLCPFFTRA